jgi:hypothetical protein
MMAKGQVRGNREARKPKKDKAAPKAAPAAGSQVKLAVASLGSGKKEK